MWRREEQAKLPACQLLAYLASTARVSGFLVLVQRWSCCIVVDARRVSHEPQAGEVAEATGPTSWIP